MNQVLTLELKQNLEKLNFGSTSSINKSNLPWPKTFAYNANLGLSKFKFLLEKLILSRNCSVHNKKVIYKVRAESKEFDNTRLAMVYQRDIMPKKGQNKLLDSTGDEL